MALAAISVISPPTLWPKHRRKCQIKNHIIICIVRGVPDGVPGVPDGVPGVPDGVPGVPDGVPGVLNGVPDGVPGGVPGVRRCAWCA
jgi:hypothetical protein